MEKTTKQWQKLTNGGYTVVEDNGHGMHRDYNKYSELKGLALDIICIKCKANRRFVFSAAIAEVQKEQGAFNAFGYDTFCEHCGTRFSVSIENIK